MEPEEPPQCGDATVWWPEREAVEVVCARYQGHAGDHADDSLGLSWPSD